MYYYIIHKYRKTMWTFSIDDAYPLIAPAIALFLCKLEIPFNKKLFGFVSST